MNLRVPPLTLLLIALSASVFYFLKKNNTIATDVLFIGVYLTICIFFVFRVLFYFKYKATLNELFFYFFVNGIVLFILALGSLTTFIQQPYYSFTIIINSDQNLQTDTFFSVTALSLALLQFLLVSSSLQIRSFTKYDFIRYTPTSEKGINAEWLAIVIFFVVGALFIVISEFVSDFLILMYGILYLLSGLLYLLSGLFN